MHYMSNNDFVWGTLWSPFIFIVWKRVAWISCLTSHFVFHPKKVCRFGFWRHEGYWLTFFFDIVYSLNSMLETWAAQTIWSGILNSHTCTLWLWIDLPLFDLPKANLWPKQKIYIYLLKQQCCCLRSLEALRVHCFAQTLMPATQGGEKERETIELMSAMRHLNKLYQTSPKIIP